MSKPTETIMEAIETLFDLDALQRSGIRQIIASAIREAQASARNEALEEAAAMIERSAPIVADFSTFTASERVRIKAYIGQKKHDAVLCRNLKTKD